MNISEERLELVAKVEDWERKIAGEHGDDHRAKSKRAVWRGCIERATEGIRRIDEIEKEQDMSVGKAEAVVAALTAKREALVATVASHDETRAKVAFAAHTADDKKARRQLDEVNVQAATYQSELRSLDAAITTAQGHLAVAQAIEADQQDHEDALALREAIAEFVDHGQALDRAVKAMIVESQALATALNKMHAAGATTPNHRQFLALGGRAICTLLIQLPWGRDLIRPLPPGQRHSFAQLVEEWARPSRASVSRRLSEREAA
jgi:hypothetical protein